MNDDYSKVCPKCGGEVCEAPETMGDTISCPHCHTELKSNYDEGYDHESMTEYWYSWWEEA